MYLPETACYRVCPILSVLLCRLYDVHTDDEASDPLRRQSTTKSYSNTRSAPPERIQYATPKCVQETNHATNDTDNRRVHCGRRNDNMQEEQNKTLRQST